MVVIAWHCLIISSVLQRSINAASAAHKDDHRLEGTLIKSVNTKPVRPKVPDKAETATINATAFLQTIVAIDEIKMEITVDLTLKLSWNDPRLVYGTPVAANISKQQAIVTLYPELSSRIWQPSIYFPNAREGKLFDLTSPNQFIIVEPNGTVESVSRYSLTCFCKMDLSLFPFDKQICTVDISTFNSDKLLLQWQEGDVLLDEEFTLPKFMLISATTAACGSTNSTGFSQQQTQPKFSSDRQSCLQIQLSIDREFPLHIMETFLPTILFVVSSWLGFWIDPDPGAVPGRIGLPIVLMLTIVGLSSRNIRDLPPLSYVNALDIWLNICTCFVFLSLIESTLVNFMFEKKRIFCECSRSGCCFKPKPKRNKFSVHTQRQPNNWSSSKRTIHPTNFTVGSQFNSLWLSDGVSASLSEACQNDACFRDTSISNMSANTTDGISFNSINHCRHKHLFQATELQNSTIADRKLFHFTPKKAHETLDNFARIVFPCAFLIVMASYFCVIAVIRQQ